MPRTISDQQIIEAALAVLLEYGYDGATTRQIAAAAGMNEVTLFRRFGSKQNLLSAVVEQEVTHFQAARIEYSGDLEGDLLKVIHFYHHIMTERGKVVGMLLSELPRHPELRELLNTPMQIMARITAMIGRYQQEGRLRAEPPMQAFLALVGPLFLGGVLGGLRTELSHAGVDPAALVRHYLQGRAELPPA